MNVPPSQNALMSALRAAGSAHHDYESRFLGGEHDLQWPGWYAAYVLGRLGDFAAPTDLAQWLQDAPAADDWADAASAFVRRRLESE
jgi:hypothetical protein